MSKRESHLQLVENKLQTEEQFIDDEDAYFGEESSLIAQAWLGNDSSNESELANQGEIDILNDNQVEEFLKARGDINEVDLYLRQIRDFPLITPQREIELLTQMNSGSPVLRAKAREELVKANLRLVVSIAKHYSSSRIPFIDLIQAGNVGLMVAADKFEDRGLHFSTMAFSWIRQSITRTIANKSRTIRLPIHINDKLNRFNRNVRDMAEALEHEPTIEEIMEASGLTKERVEYFLGLNRMSYPASLELPIMNAEGTETDLGDFIVAGDSTENTHERSEAAALIKEILGQLPERERLVLMYRNGFLVEGDDHVFENGAASLAEVGKIFGISRERARQLEAQALRRLQSTRIKLLKPYLSSFSEKE